VVIFHQLAREDVGRFWKSSSRGLRKRLRSGMKLTLSKEAIAQVCERRVRPIYGGAAG